jgi:uncharacterized protein YndB with AHSA1/START domain
MISSTDRIEKRVLLRASQERVWRAISDAAEFGSWFGVELRVGIRCDPDRAPGRRVRSERRRLEFDAKLIGKHLLPTKS